MRRLTLILSDLYLPEESAPGGLPAAVDLPGLDALLRFASRRQQLTGWRPWLAEEAGALGLSKLPIAQVCAWNTLSPAEAGGAWLATPVHLEARLDHVRLADRGLLALAPHERNALRSDFDATFGPQYRLHDLGERGFLLSGLANTSVPTTDPARLLDADIGPALPTGPAAAELRRLGAEIEMWLHAAPLNAARERLRQPRISALWLWGGGPRAGESDLERADVAAARQVLLLGADPFLVALDRILYRRGNAPRIQSVPDSFGALITDTQEVAVELAPLSGAARDALHSLEANWFAPARAALASRALSEFVFVANDCRFVTPAGSAWKIWRSRRPWLSQLATRR